MLLRSIGQPIKHGSRTNSSRLLLAQRELNSILQKPNITKILAGRQGKKTISIDLFKIYKDLGSFLAHTANVHSPLRINGSV